MRLIDTSAWIEYYREEGIENYKNEIILNLKNNLAATCGLIKTELLMHTKNKKEYNLLESDLSGIHWLETNIKIYNKSAEIGFGLRRKGMTIPVTDLIIAACAIIYKTEIIHFDKHFEQIKKYCPLTTISFNI